MGKKGAGIEGGTLNSPCRRAEEEDEASSLMGTFSLGSVLLKLFSNLKFQDFSSICNLTFIALFVQMK